MRQQHNKEIKPIAGKFHRVEAINKLSGGFIW
jgi:hypothetical protein